ncbi:MAG TPA: 50S ribosomal protein L9 [Rubricoccaceae bacterium]|nr:50S ribosomal protein L9 [Rubricoccaceae bacterium]
MKVILMEDLENLGQKGEVVEVRDGYGRNFLIPRKMAVVANAGNARRYEEERRQQSRKIEQARTDAASLAARLEDLELVLPARVGEEDRLFGTITTQHVADALAAQGIPVDRRKIALREEIRMTGVYRATVKLHPEHTAELKLKVVPEEEPAA